MSGVTTTNPVSKSRPKTSSAYLTASALYNAGFRGWPLTVMTALAGRESKWDPTALNNNPNTGDYSVGLYQINYYGDLLAGRTAEYGSPSTLLSNPQDQANAVYKLAGGNALSNLQPWALTSSPASGVTPVGSTASVGQNTLQPYMASSIAAAAEVGTFGPASASQIAQANAWPGASPIGSALTSGGDTSAPAATQALLAGSSAAKASGCSAKGQVFNADLKVTSVSLTYCELKAIIGGLTIAAGGLLLVIGVASLLVGAVGSKVAKGGLAPTIIVAQAAGKVASAPRRRSQARQSPAQAAPDAGADRAAARAKWERDNGRPWSQSDAGKRAAKNK